MLSFMSEYNCAVYNIFNDNLYIMRQDTNNIWSIWMPFTKASLINANKAFINMNRSLYVHLSSTSNAFSLLPHEIPIV